MLCGVFLCLGAGYVLTHPAVMATWTGSVIIDESKYYKVAYVIDGDTFVTDVDGRDITVRMLGIDTPETVDPRKGVQCYGPEASNESKRLLASSSVRLVANKDREAKDKYGRYLMYVYLEDGTSINEYLLKNGYAREYTFGRPYSFQKEFKESEDEARLTKKGLWSKCEFTDGV